MHECVVDNFSALVRENENVNLFSTSYCHLTSIILNALNVIKPKNLLASRRCLRREQHRL